ncbi:MAG: T9SS type A sorting domain-containing protein, partial [Prevotella sp.]|nr:T9SS type A sorting domain-containing protein [Prevotella sp.]
EVVLTTAAGATVSENSTTERQFQLNGLTPGTAYVAKVRTVCGDGQYSDFASVSFTTNSVGIADVTAPACTIYPNPTSGATTVSVSGISGKVRIAIVDMNGREVTSETLDCSGDCAKTMSVDNLAQGAYFVRITGENANMVRKLIVR